MQPRACCYVKDRAKESAASSRRPFAVAERARAPPAAALSLSLSMPPDPLLLIRKAKAEKKKAPLALSCASDALPPLELPQRRSIFDEERCSIPDSILWIE